MERVKKEVISFLPYVGIIILVLLFKHFLYTPIVVHGESMMPTLHDKDIMILDKISPRISGYKRFDIVVVKIPGETLIKRIVGLPGEKIEYKDGKLYINDKVVKDKYNNDNTEDFFSITLDKNQYFVLGDNRGNSVDSRIVGPINKNKILGRAKLTLFPFNRIGIK